METVGGKSSSSKEDLEMIEKKQLSLRFQWEAVSV